MDGKKTQMTETHEVKFCDEKWIQLDILHSPLSFSLFVIIPARLNTINPVLLLIRLATSACDGGLEDWDECAFVSVGIESSGSVDADGLLRRWTKARLFAAGANPGLIRCRCSRISFAREREDSAPGRKMRRMDRMQEA